MLMFKKVAVSDEKQADGAMAELANIDRKLATITVTMNEAIAKAKADAKKESAVLEDRRKVLLTAIKKWATINKPLLFVKKRSLDLAFGSLGFKRSESIKQMNGIDATDTLALLQQFNYDDGIRTVLEINKDGMAQWPDDKLTTVGLRRVKSDTFFCNPTHDKITSQ